MRFGRRRLLKLWMIRCGGVGTSSGARIEERGRRKNVNDRPRAMDGRLNLKRIIGLSYQVDTLLISLDSNTMEYQNLFFI